MKSPPHQKASQKNPGSLFSVRISQKDPGQRKSIFFVVSKKVAKTAVSRNTLRRRCAHASRELVGAHPINKTITFFLKDAAIKSPFNALKDALKHEYERLGII